MFALEIARKVRNHAAELIAAGLVGTAVPVTIFAATQFITPGESHADAMPATSAVVEMDACTWNETAGQWITRTGALCRGTGEDPVFMPNGTVTDVPDMWADMPHDGRATDEDSREWDCRTMGNQFCGYGNYQGAIPGYYGRDHGVNTRPA